MKLILKVTPGTAAQPLDRLLGMTLGLDIWVARSDHLVLRTDEARAERLRQLGYGVEQLHLTRDYLERHFTAAAVADYHSPESLNDDMSALAAAHPDIAELRTIGASVQNRPILALRLGLRRNSEHKVLFVGCHHAREWISVEVPFRLARHLLDHAEEAEVATWLSGGEIWIAPMVNPDGHAFTRDRSDPENRLWRKNRRDNGDGTTGVDPNRNYDFQWGTLDIDTSSKTPGAETYIGPRAFSEPESKAVADLVDAQKFRGVVTYHSYSQLILHPWGYTRTPIANHADHERLAGLGRQMAKSVKSVHGRVYVPEQASKLYPTAGDTTDWAYGKHQIPAITIELRPDSHDEGGFILPPDQIAPAFEENLPAALDFIRAVF
ncbi:MAG TPA: M14 family metallopeptidase [Stellaceae bacterium]|jgi:carboxypeptidase T